MSLSTSLAARNYAAFRETRHGRAARAVTNEDEATPITKLVTATGDTTILASQGAAAHYAIKGFQYSNNGAAGTVVSLKAGDGDSRFTAVLADDGSFTKNLSGEYWVMPNGKAIIANLPAGGSVYVTVEYEVEGEPGEEAGMLSDALVITESLATAFGDFDVLTDAQAIAEANAKVAKSIRSDSMAIVESLALTVADRSEVHSDTLAIAESVGNKTTLSLSDSITFVAALSVSFP